MPLQLGSSAALFRVGSGSPAKVFLGSVAILNVPGAPTAVSGTAGDEQVSLTWSAPSSNGGSAITDYTVQYSSDSGSTWATFSRSASTNTNATVTSLTNGTGYVFRVAAVNAIGTGAYSASSSSVTPASAGLTLYFDGAEDGDWAELGNWWTDGPGIEPAAALPAAADSVIATATISSNSGSAPTVANLTMETGADLSTAITVTGMATFNGSAILFSTVTGDATFNGTSVNAGTVAGNATFNDNTANSGAVNNTATFNDSACNQGGTAAPFVPDPPPSC